MSFIKNKISIILISIFCFSFIACSNQIVKIETKEVLIPVKCEAEVPKKPPREKDLPKMIIKLLKYIESLEVIVNACVNDTSTITSE